MMSHDIIHDVIIGKLYQEPPHFRYLARSMSVVDSRYKRDTLYPYTPPVWASKLLHPPSHRLLVSEQIFPYTGYPFLFS